jgi:hypothetical protein
MLIAVILAIGAALAVMVCFGTGLVLCWRGLHGVMIDQHPRCRRCCFDLTGHALRLTVCAECGADLTVPGSVTRRSRQSCPGLVWAGVTLLLISAAPIMLVFFADTLRAARSPTRIAVPVPAAQAPAESRVIVPSRTYNQALFAAATATDEPGLHAAVTVDSASGAGDTASGRRRSNLAIVPSTIHNHLNGLPSALAFDGASAAMGLHGAMGGSEFARNQLGRARASGMTGSSALGGMPFSTLRRGELQPMDDDGGATRARAREFDASTLVGRMAGLKVDAEESASSPERISNRIDR